MSGKANMKLTDDLIREAIHRDLESVTPPPAEKSWRRIEAGLRMGRLTARRSYTWGRHAAVAAAACLLIALGSLGILRFPQLVSPAADESLAVGPDGEVEIMPVELDENDVKVYEEDDRVVSAVEFVQGISDPAPPEWAAFLPGGFVFDEAILLTAAGEPHYHGAFYFNGQAQLLKVKSSREEDLDLFLDHLGRHIESAVPVIGEVDGYAYFETVGKPGLAWQKENRNQALLVVSGFIAAEDLQSIAASLD